MIAASLLSKIVSGVVIAAAVAALGTLLVTAIQQHERAVQRRVDALTRFYAAVGAWAAFAMSFTEQKRGWLDELNFRVMSNLLSATLVRRVWAVTDSVLTAGAEVRANGDAGDITVVDEVEVALGSWSFGQSLPDEMTQALRKLRARIEYARKRRWLGRDSV